MKKWLVVPLLAAALACASAQKTEFKTVTAATQAVEVARSAYQDARGQCTANPTAFPICPQIVAAHDPLMGIYVKYQAAVKALADANIAAIQIGSDPTTSQKVADAGAALIAVAEDFVSMEQATTGGK